MLETLINDAQSLNRSLQIALKDAQTANAEANQLAASARIHKNKLDAKEIELNERERSLKQCEDPIHAAANAREIKSENKALAAQIEEEKQDLAKQKREFAADMAKQRTDLKLAQDEVANTRENFKKQAEALKEKENKFEAKLKELGLKIA